MELKYTKVYDDVGDLVLGESKNIVFEVYPRTESGECAPGLIIGPNQTEKVGVGVDIEIPEGYFILVYSLDDYTLKVDGLVLLRSYRDGEIVLPIKNVGKHAVHITPGSPVALGVVLKEENLRALSIE